MSFLLGSKNKKAPIQKDFFPTEIGHIVGLKKSFKNKKITKTFQLIKNLKND